MCKIIALKVSSLLLKRKELLQNFQSAFFKTHFELVAERKVQCTVNSHSNHFYFSLITVSRALL